MCPMLCMGISHILKQFFKINFKIHTSFLFWQAGPAAPGPRAYQCCFFPRLLKYSVLIGAQRPSPGKTRKLLVLGKPSVTLLNTH